MSRDITIDSSDYKVGYDKSEYDLPIKVSITKSEWGYWTTIRFSPNFTDVFWSFSHDQAARRAQRRVSKYQKLKEWKENPLVMYPDVDTGELLPVELIHARALAAGDTTKKELT